jgi:hypothetical protein
VAGRRCLLAIARRDRDCDQEGSNTHTGHSIRRNAERRDVQLKESAPESKPNCGYVLSNGEVLIQSGQLRFGALFALRVSPALGGDKGCRPFPRTPFSASGILPSLRSGQASLDEAEHFLHNRSASVATLRWCSGSSRNAVRNHPGFSVRLHRNPQLAAVVREHR